MNAFADLSVRDVCESTEDEIALLRYLLDLSLQPIDQFAGFTRMEQVGSSALRYQLNFICYALAMYQYTRTPAFSGYLAEAQRSCIEKMCDRKVWGFWAWENLIGNLRWNPDPICYQNVMYSGFFGVMLGMYETLNDDQRFSQAGALTLTWNEKKVFPYHFESVAAAIRENMMLSRYTQYACEPHLVYPMCNSFALNTLFMHDRLHGTDLMDGLVDRVQTSYQRDEFLTKQGRFLGGRGPLGLKFPVFVSNDAVMAIWLRAVMPEQSERSWQLIRQHLAPFLDGEVQIGKRLINKIDFGNYSLNGAWILSFLLALSREMGDMEYAGAIQRKLDANYEVIRNEGAQAFKGVSTWVNANYALARFTEPGALQALLMGRVAEAHKQGPMLAAAAYPEVLVLKAVSDGNGLELVLAPGNGTVDTELHFSRLQPEQRYRLKGSVQTEFQADISGNAKVSIPLVARQLFQIEPLNAELTGGS